MSWTYVGTGRGGVSFLYSHVSRNSPPACDPRVAIGAATRAREHEKRSSGLVREDAACSWSQITGAVDTPRREFVSAPTASRTPNSDPISRSYTGPVQLLRTSQKQLRLLAALDVTASVRMPTKKQSVEYGHCTVNFARPCYRHERIANVCAWGVTFHALRS